jgi:hypothetical protein
MDWNSTHEARAAWEGYLWSPRLYRPLIEAMKLSFLDTANHYASLGKYADQYAALLTWAALELGDVFSVAELVRATHSLPAQGLAEAADFLARTAEGSGEQRADYWSHRVEPYLHAIWPKAEHLITAEITESFARLCVAAQEKFPEALARLRPWRRPLSDADFPVHRLRESQLCDRFPSEALMFLCQLIDVASQWVPSDLAACLKAIEKANPELASREAFQQLDSLVRGIARRPS